MRRWFLILILVLLSTTIIIAQDSEGHYFPDVQGTVAWVGNDYNIYSMDFSQTRNQLTQDGSELRQYQFPTWSPNGQLAYFCCNNRAISRVRAEVYISSDGVVAGDTIYAESEESVVYPYWSANQCDDTINCFNLSVLLNDISTSDMQVELFSYREHLTMGRGVPFYYSWSPDGKQILRHLNNETLDIYDLELNSVSSTLALTPGSFFAPAWSPTDNRLLVATRGDERFSSNLVISDNGQEQILLENVPGQISFQWSPNGEYIAYKYVTRDETSPLIVINSSTGDFVTQSSVSGALAFFWAPDSQRIAYLSVATPPGTFDVKNGGQQANLVQLSEGFAWSSLDISTGIDWSYGAFLPTQELVYLLVYFDQFSQSHQLWSPDSTHIAYAEQNADDETVINVLDMTSPDNVPLVIDFGVFAVWSYG